MRFWGPVFLFYFLFNGLFASFERPISLPDFSLSKHPVETLAFVNLGLNRFAADIDMIRLFIYYGASEAMADDLNPPKNAPLYPGIFPRAEEILSLDPYFNYARLYAAGALAFNLNRSDEALRLMQEGLNLEPENKQYKSYIAAIAFSKKGDPQKVVDTLSPYLKNPDTPSMLLNISAFIYFRLGEMDQATTLYQRLLDSRNPEYHLTARKMLQKIKRHSYKTVQFKKLKR